MVARCKLGCTRFSRCCYLIIDLYSPLSKGSWARSWSQSPDLGGRARLFGCHPSLFFAPFSFFLLFPISHRETSNQDRPRATIANSLDPYSIPCFAGSSSL